MSEMSELAEELLLETEEKMEKSLESSKCSCWKLTRNDKNICSQRVFREVPKYRSY